MKPSAPAYYLSTYLSPPRLSNLLGITPRHDNNLSLWLRTGTKLELIRHWELERLSGEKQHGRPFPSVPAARAFIATLLAGEGVGWDDITACWGTPGLDFGAPYGSPVPGLPLHAVAHAYTGLYSDSDIFHTGRILCFAPDGGPDHVLGRTVDWYAGAYVDHGRCTWFAAESPGRIYDSARKAFGMREGTLMALAAACPVELPVDAATLVEDLRFRGAAPHDILGGAVSAGETVLTRALAEVDRCFGAGIPDSAGFSPGEVRIAAVMQLLQSACEAVMIRNVETFLASNSVDLTRVHLALAGGYALNCPTNSMLMERYGFAGLLAPPCANDSGQALGVGLALLHQEVPALQFRLGSAYHGGGASDMAAAVAAFAGAVTIDDSGEFPANFVADVQAAPVAWVVGNSEIGPRALGHRSILADPRRIGSKEQLNLLKGRQWWRPVAPVVLESHVSEWFETDRPSPYMLQTARIRPSRAAQVPAITHLDGSARLQTLTAAGEPLLHRALQTFFEHTGVPMLGNTSLNGPAQPIVQTVQQALSFCADRGIRVCYVDGTRLLVDVRTAAGPAPVYAFPPAADRPPARRDAYPHGLTGPDLYHAMTTPDLHQADLSDPDDCARVRTAAQTHYQRFPNDLAWVRQYLRRASGRVDAGGPAHV
ncbi:carbamoyltransferase C-terminal domain-containing protein [Dactylosporangium sp. NPDC005555]|uniref:carbamoyltransferase C-terminal domain-containing protein n=1 Tax=Dactylosporangium sp. NPDC005555 TaxID=3154889 RepID=UPI0033B810E0